MQQCSGKSELLLHPFRKRSGFILAAVPQTQQAQVLVNLTLFIFDPVKAGINLQVALCAQIIVSARGFG
jgi:hypothetical protein